MNPLLLFALRNPRLTLGVARVAVRGTATAVVAGLRHLERLQGVSDRQGVDADRVAALEHSTTVLYNTHLPGECLGEACPIHRRSNHGMRGWPQVWRGDAGFVERVCSHGVGHPDPDDPKAPPAHGCDGCCRAATRRH